MVDLLEVVGVMEQTGGKDGLQIHQEEVQGDMEEDQDIAVEDIVDLVEYLEEVVGDIVEEVEGLEAVVEGLVEVEVDLEEV